MQSDMNDRDEKKKKKNKGIGNTPETPFIRPQYRNRVSFDARSATCRQTRSTSMAHGLCTAPGTNT